MLRTFYLLLIGLSLGACEGTDWVVAKPGPADRCPDCDPAHRWQGVGGSELGLDHDTAGYLPSLALDPAGLPTLAWRSPAGNASRLRVQRFDGERWVSIDPEGFTLDCCASRPDPAWGPSLGLLPGNAPVLTWRSATDPDNGIFVIGAMGGTWQELGAGSATGLGIAQWGINVSAPVLAVDDQGRVFVTWSSSDMGEFEVFVRRHDAGAWQAVEGPGSRGGIAGNDAYKHAVAIAVGPEGQPVVAWTDFSNLSNDIYVRQLVGASWEEVGAGSASGGGVTRTIRAASSPRLAVDSRGRPVLAWLDGWSDGMVYARRFDGQTWEELGGSASGGGVSGPAAAVSSLALTVDGHDEPVVAWSDASSGLAQIYLRRFDGRSWREATPGAASGGGVSNSAAAALSPAIAAQGDRVCVAWSEVDAERADIVLRCTRW